MGSVWNEEVDRALIKLIEKTVKYKDDTDTLATPNIVVRNPEGEFQIKKFPSVSFFNYNQKFASERFQDVKTVTSVNDLGEATISPPAIPYDLSYQIDFWSEYHEDINEMTRRWSGNVMPRTALEVIDSEGNTRHSVMNLIDYEDIRELEDGVQVHHRAYSYKIWVELDERDPEYSQLAKELIVNNEGV